MERKKQCWECQTRRLVCDSTRPKCTKCKKRGVNCSGYSGKPFVWVPTGKVTSTKAGTPLTRSRRHKHGRATSESSRRPDADSCTISGATPGISESAVLPISTYLPLEIYHLAEAIEYCKLRWCSLRKSLLNAISDNASISPDLVSSGSLRNLYAVKYQQIKYFPVSILNIFMTIALSHRIVQQRGHLPPTSSDLATKFYRYRGAAIQALNNELSTRTTLCTDEIIASVLIFLLTEISMNVSFYINLMT
jgi:hypothetical protein